MDELYSCLDQQLAEWHNALAHGPAFGLIRCGHWYTRRSPARLFKAVLDDRIRAGRVVHQDQLIRAFGHRPSPVSPGTTGNGNNSRRSCKQGAEYSLRSEIQHDTGFDAKRLEALTRPAIKTGRSL